MIDGYKSNVQWAKKNRLHIWHFIRDLYYEVCFLTSGDRYEKDHCE
jgi:hypothetical protein